MTDKIIIDGVDVSGCNYAILPKKQCPMKSMPYAKETSCTACKELNTKLNFCKNNPNCYYKQLARKTEECEKLKTQLIQRDDIDTFFNTPIEGWFNDPCGVCEYKGEYKQLKSENERLKEENRQALKQLEFSRTHKTLLYTESIKYKQALDEIEKIIKDLKENCVYGIYGKFVNTECLGCVYRLGCYRVSKKEILQIIKAVKDEKEL